MINHQRYVSLFLITVLFVSLLSFSIPQNNERLEENNTPMYDKEGDSPHGGERIGMILTQEENYEYVYHDDGVVPMKFLVENLTDGEEYTIEWKQERYGEIFESGSINFIGDNETNALDNDDNTLIRKDNVSFEITAPTNREIFSINASLMDENGTELHWYLDIRTTYHGYEWAKAETDWRGNVDIEGAWGDEISLDYTFTNLNPEQEYNMSWCLIKHSDRAYGCATVLGNENAIIEGDYSIITPDADGNYDTSVSFDMLESWGEERVCIEYNIKIDEVESRGQWHERCVHFEPETLGGLPSVSGFATIISVLCAAIIFTPKRYPASSNEDDES